MKAFILIFLLFSLLYYLFESIFNRFTIGNIVESKLKKNNYCFFGFASVWSCLLGGVSATIIYLFYLIPYMNKLPIIVMMVIGGLVITLVELGFGLLLNKKLKLNIWDYSNSKIGKIPVNFLGQIDIYHSIGWIGITYLIVKIFNFLNWVMT